MQTVLKIVGMQSEIIEEKVKETLLQVHGVHSVEVDHLHPHDELSTDVLGGVHMVLPHFSGNAIIEHERTTSLEELERALVELGFEVSRVQM